MDLQTLLSEVQSALGMMDISPLSQGGQKIVLEGTLSGAPAVAKVVRITPGPNGNIALERANREVELLAAIDSDHVVRVLSDAVEIGDPIEAVCWVEEKLDGQDLASCLADTWTEEEVWALLSDLTGGLEACHDLDVVHRDLSPGNVRRTQSGRYVLMDPGLARHLEKTALTGEFQPGTPGWRSPEHVLAGDPVPASDIFALGILAFYALTKELPVSPGHDNAEYDRRLTETQVPSVLNKAQNISTELAAVIDRCLQRQPARRYLDGSELRETLSELGRYKA